MDCLICLEPIHGAPFQSAKRLTCECKVPTHELCYRQYRVAKGHTECIICHNREYVRHPRRSSVSDDEAPDHPLHVDSSEITALIARALATHSQQQNIRDAEINELIERVLAAQAQPPPPPPSTWASTLWDFGFLIAVALASAASAAQR